MDIDITQFEGAITSPDDVRDIIAGGDMSQEIKRPEACPSPFFLREINQFSNPATYYACVGCATAGIRQILSRLQSVTEDYDYARLYNDCKAIDGLSAGIQGTTLRAALSVAKNTGIRTTSGKIRKIREYKKIEDPNDQAQIETALFLHHGILAAVTLSNNGWKGETVRPPYSGEKTSGHGIIITGYDNGAYICHDSMPSYHNNQDSFRMEKTYKINEAWAVTCDDSIPPASGLYGYVAKQYVSNGQTTARVNLRITPNGNVIKVLPLGTKLKAFNDEIQTVGGIQWIYIEIL